MNLAGAKKIPTLLLQKIQVEEFPAYPSGKFYQNNEDGILKAKIQKLEEDSDERKVKTPNVYSSTANLIETEKTGKPLPVVRSQTPEPT